MDAADEATADREVDALVLALLVPVALLLVLMAMERVEARLCPVASTGALGEGGTEPPVDREADEDLAAPPAIPPLAIPAQPIPPLAIPAQAVAGAVAVRAIAP